MVSDPTYALMPIICVPIMCDPNYLGEIHRAGVGIAALAAVQIVWPCLQRPAAPYPALGEAVEARIRRRLPADGECERW